MEAVGLDPGAAQIVAEALAHDLGIAEDNDPLEGPGAQDPQHGFLFFQAGHGDGILVDVGLALLGGSHGDLHLVALVHPTDGHDLLGDGGGKQAQIDTVFDLVEDLGHVVEEAHVQHPVGLVQNDGLDLVQPEIFAVVVVHEPSRCRHDDMGVTGQGLDLGLHALTAVDHGDADVLVIDQQAVQFIGDLDGQLPGGSKDQRLQILRRRVDVLDHGDAESKGLACPRRRLGNHVPPLQQGRNGLLLDLGGQANAFFLQRPQDLLADTQFTKGFCCFHTGFLYFFAENSQYFAVYLL